MQAEDGVALGIDRINVAREMAAQQITKKREAHGAFAVACANHRDATGDEHAFESGAMAHGIPGQFPKGELHCESKFS